MIKPKSPCIKCKQRSGMCHATCKGYEEWKKELDKYNEHIKHERQIERESMDYAVNRKRPYTKRSKVIEGE